MEIFIHKLSPIYIGWTVLQNMGATQITFLLLPVEEYQPPTNQRERRKRRRLFANEEKPKPSSPFSESSPNKKTSRPCRERKYETRVSGGFRFSTKPQVTNCIIMI